MKLDRSVYGDFNVDLEKRLDKLTMRIAFIAGCLVANTAVLALVIASLIQRLP